MYGVVDNKSHKLHFGNILWYAIYILKKDNSSQTPFLLCLGGQSSGAGGAVGVKVRLLANADGTVAEAVAKTIVVVGGAVEGTAVVPDGNVVLVAPLEADLQIVVLLDALVKELEQLLALLGAELVNAAGKVANGKDGLPARNRVGADNGVDGQ